jgi:hypothetical protein
MRSAVNVVDSCGVLVLVSDFARGACQNLSSTKSIRLKEFLVVNVRRCIALTGAVWVGERCREAPSS